MNGIQCAFAGVRAEVLDGRWRSSDRRLARLLNAAERLERSRVPNRHTLYVDDYVSAESMAQAFGGEVLSAPRYRDPLPPDAVD